MATRKEWGTTLLWTPAEKIKHLLYPLLSLPGLKLPYRNTHLRALKLYALYAIDYEDCLTVAHMERQRLRKLYSYDRDFDQMKHIKRVESNIAASSSKKK